MDEGSVLRVQEILLRLQNGRSPLELRQESPVGGVEFQRALRQRIRVFAGDPNQSVPFAHREHGNSDIRDRQRSARAGQDAAASVGAESPAMIETGQSRRTEPPLRQGRAPVRTTVLECQHAQRRIAHQCERPPKRNGGDRDGPNLVGARHHEPAVAEMLGEDVYHWKCLMSGSPSDAASRDSRRMARRRFVGKWRAYTALYSIDGNPPRSRLKCAAPALRLIRRPDDPASSNTAAISNRYSPRRGGDAVS